MDDRINARIPKDLKRELEDKKIPVTDIIRDALEKAVGRSNDIKCLVEDEEELFGMWADSFVRLYQFLNKKLADRDALIIADAAKLEELWKRVEERMKTREQLMEEIPELKALTYDDIFDWDKHFKIIEKYPKTLQGRLGHVQIREAILYREVKKGNFTGIAEAKEKFRAELELRTQKMKEELQAWTSSEEYEKQYLLKQEELALEKQRELHGHPNPNGGEKS